jgi:predicted metal-dependent hydrolase
MPNPNYEIFHSKRKTIALIVQPDGRLVVRAPLRATQRQIEEIVNAKAGWIKKVQKKMIEQAEQFSPCQFTPGEEFPYLGSLYPLEIVERARPALQLESTFKLSKKSLPTAPAVFTRWYKAQAMPVIQERVLYFASRYGFTYDRLRITSARTRWGSCTSTSSLNFTWYLVMAPLAVIDYVVLHELAHTRHRNHQKAFWALVASIMPDYKTRKKWLKENGGALRRMI